MTPEQAAVKRAWRHANPEKVAAIKRRYRERHRAKVEAAVRAWKEAHPEAVKEQRRRWKEAHPESVLASWRKSGAMQQAKHPDRVSARLAVGKALESGRLSKMPCEICGATTNLHAHHAFGYQPEFALWVWWLCAPHHRGLHAAIQRSV